MFNQDIKHSNVHSFVSNQIVYKSRNECVGKKAYFKAVLTRLHNKVSLDNFET